MGYNYVEITDLDFSTFNNQLPSSYYTKGYWELGLEGDLSLKECKEAGLVIYYYATDNHTHYYVARWIATFWLHGDNTHRGKNLIQRLGKLLKNEAMKAKWSFIAASSLCQEHPYAAWNYYLKSYMDELYEDLVQNEALT